MLQMWKAEALLFSLNNKLLLSIPKFKKKTTNKQTKTPHPPDQIKKTDFIYFYVFERTQFCRLILQHSEVPIVIVAAWEGILLPR